MVAGHRGAGASIGIPLLSVPGVVLRGCGNGLPGKGILPVVDGRGLGTCLGRVTSIYNVGGGLAFRLTHRAFTAAAALTGNMPVRAIDGVLKRAGVRAARVCTHVAGGGVDGSVRKLSGGFINVRGVCGRMSVG